MPTGSGTGELSGRSSRSRDRTGEGLEALRRQDGVLADCVTHGLYRVAHRGNEQRLRAGNL